MLKIVLVIFVALFSFYTFSQTVLMGNVGYPETSPADCNTFGVSGQNFFDDGGAVNYTPNFNDTTVFCPDLTLGTKMTITFAVTSGFTFDVDGSDSIYIFDGPTASSPLLGAHNSVTDPIGFAYTASWSNPSGCLTVVFISDGAIEGTGWAANVACGNQNEPFEPHIVAYINGTGSNALLPADTGFVDICFGDSILFIAQPVFPNSLESTGFGYSQTVDNVNFDWNISDGSSHPNNDSIWFTPQTRNGFLIDLKITDAFPQIERMLCKVRVSQIPSFAGTGSLEDSICLGSTTNLLGGVTIADTVGVDIPTGTFQLGGSFAGLTYLPDGSGAQYAAPIDISSFPAGSVISTSQDLNQVCITMEHSYLGDLEIALECPSGVQVTLINSYSPGFIPGGTSGGGIFMGDPIDDSGGGGPGEGWEYCFSSVFNTWGDYPTELAAGNTIPAPLFGMGGASMNPNGVYLPEQDFSAFAGCPINGTWTIIVQDNLGIDDGYIFEWGLFFDPSFFPGSSSYQNTVATSDWLADPTIISGLNDTSIVVQPITTGDAFYTFSIIDNFGCYYDTTVSINVLPLPTIFTDTIVCSYGLNVLGTNSYANGVWTSPNSEIHFSDSSVLNPFIFTDNIAGQFTVTFTDSKCNASVSAVIDFPEYPGTWLTDSTLCKGVEYIFTAPNENAYTTSYQWDDGTSGETITFQDPGGTYALTMTNVCYTAFDTIIIDYKLCDIEAPNVISLAQGSQNPLWYVKTDGLKEFSLVITNRWGNVIYECSNSEGSCYWDGTDRKGNFVGEGTYFYIINATTEGEEELNKHGFIQVVK